jgi:hypothetical protein
LAVIVTVVAVETFPAVAVNVAVFDPAGTVTVAGTERTELLRLVSVITVETAALAVRVTVPVVCCPCLTVVGLKAMAESVGALTVNGAVRV